MRSQIIGSRILDNFKFLKNISRSKSEKRRLHLLRNASREELLSLVEVASNIISANFSLTKRQRDRFLPHAHFIRQLARVRSEKGARRVVQRGGGAFLTSLLIPIVSEAASYLLSKANKGVVEDT